MIRRPALLRGSLLVLASTLIWHVSNFGFNSAAARLLGPAEYGSLTAVLALLTVAGPCFSTVQAVASREATARVLRGETAWLRGLIWRYGVRLAFGGVLCAAFLTLMATAIARFLRVPSAAPIAILSTLLVFSLVTHLQRGVLQGTKSFGRYATSTIIEAAAKIGTVLALLLFVSRSVDAAVLAVSLSGLVAVVANWALLRRLPAERSVPRIVVPAGTTTLAFASLVLLALLFSVDVLAAKRYLAAEAAGLYAAVSLTGKIVFYATSALAYLLFPYFSTQQERGEDARRLLLGALGIVGSASGAMLLLYFVGPSVVVRPLFGSSYAAAEQHIGWMGLAFAFYAWAYLAALYLISHRDAVGAAALAVLVIGQLAGLYTFHGSIGALVAVDLAVFAVAAVVLVALCLRDRTELHPALEPR